MGQVFAGAAQHLIRVRIHSGRGGRVRRPCGQAGEAGKYSDRHQQPKALRNARMFCAFNFHCNLLLGTDISLFAGGFSLTKLHESAIVETKRNPTVSNLRCGCRKV